MHGDKYIPRIMNNIIHTEDIKPRATRERAICIAIEKRPFLYTNKSPVSVLGHKRALYNTREPSVSY